MKNFQCLSGSWLKVFAMVTMTIGHTAALLPYFWEHPMLYTAMRNIGRIAFITFAFLLVEGFVHTHDRKKYGRNLAIFAIISQLPYSLIYHQFLAYSHPNVGFTLLFAFCGMYAMETIKEEKIKLAAVLALILLITILIRPVRSYMGIGLIWVFYLLRSVKLPQLFVGFCMIARGHIMGQFLGFALLALYNGKRGFIRGSFGKYFFYSFYPLHLLLLYLLRMYLYNN